MNAAAWTGLWPLLAVLGLMALSAVLMLLPFVPAWREWRRPRDAAPLPLSPLVSPSPRASQASGTSAPAPDAAAPAGPYATRSASPLHWPAGQPFALLQAPTVWLGLHGHTTIPERWLHPSVAPAAKGVEGSRDAPEAGLNASDPRGVPPVPGAQPWGVQGWRIEGDARLKPGLRLHGPLVVHGALQLGEGCRVAGDVKVHGPVQLGPRSQIGGALVALQDVVLGAGSAVTGPLLAQGHLHLARGARIGEPSRPTTASAQLVTAASGSVVHGELQAREAGVVL